MGALDELPPAGRRRAERVQAALGDDDPTALLSPLAAAYEDLGDGHSGLAEQFRSVSDRTAKVRLDATQHAGPTTRALSS